MIFTDLDMPGMTGLELGRCVAGAVPGQKIVLTTGNDAITSAAAEEAGFFQLLRKPLTIEEIRKVVAAADRAGEGNELADFRADQSHDQESVLAAA